MTIDPFAPDSPDRSQPSSQLDHLSQPNSADGLAPPEVILSVRLFAFCGSTAFTILLGAMVARQLENRGSFRVIEAIASYLVGSFFAIGMLTVIWPALCQSAFQHRAAFSFFMLVAIFVLFFLTMGILTGGDPPPPEFYLGAAVGILGAWAIPTFPLWCLRKGLGLRIGLANHSNSKQEKQFSIGYLLAATGTIAILLGVMRAALIQLKFDFVRDFRELLFLGVFVAASFLVCFLFFVAALSRRHVALGIVVSLLMTCIVSYWELDLVVLIAGSGPGLRPYFFWLLNGSSMFWTLVFAYIIRMHGYRVEMGE